MLNDSGSEIDDEFLLSFLEESFEVVENLKVYMSEFKDPSQVDCFEKYGQNIDRIMGAAYTLSLNKIGDLARLGKELGYKTSQITDVAKLISMQSLLSQLTKTLDTALKCFKKGQHPKEDFEPLIKKLTAASAQLGNLRTTVG